MAGYSNTPLWKKLGFKPGQSVLVLDPPENYSGLVGSKDLNLDIIHQLKTGSEMIHYFSKTKDDLALNFPRLKNCLSKNGALWVSWPKKTSHLYVDLDGNAVREIGLRNGLVDVKVCAVDEDWSGLKFVWRKNSR